MPDFTNISVRGDDDYRTALKGVAVRFRVPLADFIRECIDAGQPLVEARLAKKQARGQRKPNRP